MGSLNRPQDDIVLQDEIANLAQTIPVRPELKTLLDLYGKKLRLSLMMPI